MTASRSASDAASDAASDRAEAARRAILNSGNPDLINRLHLLDAAAPARDPAAGQAPRGPSLWGSAAAAGTGALGGVMLGTILGGTVLDAQMRAAFADLAAEAGFDPASIEATLAGLPAAGTTADIDPACAEGPDGSEDDDWLGGLFDI